MKAMRRIRGCCTSAPGRRARPGNHRDQARRQRLLRQLADAQRRQRRLAGALRITAFPATSGGASLDAEKNSGWL
jgi:hypothetical protein